MCVKGVSIKNGDYGESHPNGGKWLLGKENINFISRTLLLALQIYHYYENIILTFPYCNTPHRKFNI